MATHFYALFPSLFWMSRNESINPWCVPTHIKGFLYWDGAREGTRLHMYKYLTQCSFRGGEKAPAFLYIQNIQFRFKYNIFIYTNVHYLQIFLHQKRFTYNNSISWNKDKCNKCSVLNINILYIFLYIFHYCNFIQDLLYRTYGINSK